jgi:hypothetical protein
MTNPGGTMVEDALNVLRSLVFFVGLIAANIHMLLHRKFDSAKFSRQKAEGTAV